MEYCDLPEFCDGESEWCPSDVYRQNGEVCNNGQVSSVEYYDLPEFCDSESEWCPSDVYRQNREVCNNGQVGYMLIIFHSQTFQLIAIDYFLIYSYILFQRLKNWGILCFVGLFACFADCL